VAIGNELVTMMEGRGNRDIVLVGRVNHQICILNNLSAIIKRNFQLGNSIIIIVQIKYIGEKMVIDLSTIIKRNFQLGDSIIIIAQI
jgi:hypothetical protein